MSSSVAGHTFKAKDPSATKTYPVDWGTKYLTLLADTLLTATFVVPSGLTKVGETKTGNIAYVTISGGTDNTDYDITCHIVSTAGIVDEATFCLPVRES